MATGMLKKEDERETNVTYEDQQDINTFSKHLNERIELQNFLKSRQDLKQLYEDAADELILAEDDEKIHFAIGDAFVMTAKEDAEASLEESKAKLEEQVEESEKKCDAIISEMSTLKAKLYAKFGNTINLEEG